ncbi:unnamed protein product [Trypanosoma congolense IL3000]|uniref:WGS project CAEQ00000000 data, annotated contig 2421 n=1 Tax=Trypanosoma congolense (strain IL3000) TaxID=1068625 RepID=F9WDY6_TRYCI|nr:unnamed protein product [Trypanosoma congolense IL3000]
MPQYSLLASAETEGVERIQPMRPRDWGMKVECDSCREVSPNYIYVDETEERENAGGGTRNAVFKCSFCKTVITVDVDPSSYGAYYPESEDDTPLVVMEVRGATPVELDVGSNWVVVSEGATFEGADLSTDWMEYDEKSGTAVSVSQFEVSFHRLKKGK